MSYCIQKFQSPVGTLYLVACDMSLCGLIYEKMWPMFAAEFEPAVEQETPLLRETARQLDEYFAGARQIFDLPLAWRGTSFQSKVWSSLQKIPFGETRSYKEQALAIDAPGASRAVGRADGLNPLCIVLPCHRVLGSQGDLRGYAGGLAAKRYLLELEAQGLRLRA